MPDTPQNPKWIDDRGWTWTPFDYDGPPEAPYVVGECQLGEHQSGFRMPPLFQLTKD